MIKTCFFPLVLLVCILSFEDDKLFAQTNYMQQDFSGGGPFVNANPDAGQFSHLVTTNAAASKFEFGPGYMDMTRLVATNGGLVRAVRAVPFSPNPETLYIQITFSVEEISVADLNALYFYSGENFSGTNSTFPPNANLFSRFTIDFLASSFVVHDIQTNKKSSPLPLQTPVTVTWVLNNSSDGHIYRKPESSANPDYKVMPRKYDLWVNETLLIDEADAYPGSSSYSINKLSNFEIRFWTGVGRVRFGNLRIRDVTGILPLFLVQFKAERESEKALLSWTAGLQKDTDFFVIKKSRDKSAYEYVNTVQKNEDNSEYSSYDPKPFEGLSYYRLEQIDKYGNLIDFQETTFVSEINDCVFIFPNPSPPNLIRVHTGVGALSLLKIYDLRGQEVELVKEKTDKEIIEVRPLKRMSPGLYTLSFIRNQNRESLKFLVE
ncbi:Por secretion system C-terminal sorting domain-containing protein [Dyadobacter koreensis]|uniref:Por secretion system C-terminal sorting domain-containing protein n=1 Tax=Dyadobacter koreensis TaxID=408657 RepID=A0A1H6ZFC1_9BACT|nr:T9SS type A sorting domain-containing protein [Dyadobacter koreensis]SEJ50177.1 Por secretion system C-terminal sorting domain-containing protein [Dyadobacter koreensis]